MPAERQVLAVFAPGELVACGDRACLSPSDRRLRDSLVEAIGLQRDARIVEDIAAPGVAPAPPSFKRPPSTSARLA